MTTRTLLLLLLLAQAAKLTAQETTGGPEQAMNSAFDPNTASWSIAWPERVSKHDLVYLSPPEDPMQGIALGNGDVGVLCWCEGSRLIFAVNKCDLWDDASFGQFHNWKAEEEEFSTTLRHAGRLIIDFQAPVFDVFYLSDFKGRLSLADASMAVSATTPFGNVSVRAFVDHDSGVLCCDVVSGLKESMPINVILERYGSRTFSHWYSLVNRNPALGLEGTGASVFGDSVFVTQKLTSGAFAVGCAVSGKDGVTFECIREHSHAAKITARGTADKEFTLLLAVTPPMQEDPVPEVRKALSSARDKEVPGLFTSHAAAWKAFWLRSLMESGDDYLDNLWHLTMYYANASQRGAYPGRFINGLWNWNRDVQNWNFYFHWNQQQVYWPLNAAGHDELVESYLKYRFDALPYGQQDAKEVFQTDGAVVSDVCERRGYNSASEFVNHTPVAQIAMDFWRQYTYTCDHEFLKTRALPYILEAAKFFESLFERGEDGKYHAKSGTGYEGWILLRDGITELTYGRVLFATALDALNQAGVTEPRAAKWKEMFENLAPLPTFTAGPELIAEENGTWTVKRALLKGKATYSNEILAAGFGIKENRILTSFFADDAPQVPYLDPFDLVQAMENNRTPYTGIREDMKCYDGIFPWVEFAPVYPAGLIGLASKDSREFKMAVNSARLFAIAGMGWDPLPIVLARLGLSDELTQILTLWPGRWQFYCNGFGHYGPRDLMKADGALRFRTNLVRDAALRGDEQEKEKFSFPAWPFRHMGMESMSVLSCAMNEALLQSHDGVIRIAPAAGTRDARFTLHAVGGFVVSAELEKGHPRWVSIVSEQGKTCRFDNPWPKAYVFQNGKNVRTIETDVVELPTQKGDAFLVVPEPDIIQRWKTQPAQYQPNQNAKTDSTGKARLGIDRMF